jgi:signal transduction histidine kinase
VTRTRFAAALRWFGPASAAALLLATVVLQVSTWSAAVQPLGNARAVDLVSAGAFFAWSGIGGLIVHRQPGNRIGLILLVAGLAAQAWVLLAYYAALGLLVRPGSVPGAGAAAWTTIWLPTVAFGLAFTFLFLMFPDGRLPSSRWRPFAWFVGIALAFWTFTWSTGPRSLGGAFEGVANPAALTPVGSIDAGTGWMLFVVSVLGSMWAVVVRLRRSAGTERAQLKWFTYAAAVVALTWLIVTVGSEFGPPFTTLGGLMFPFAVTVLPLAVFVAIFKHQLYDIDVVVSRTVVVAALAVLVTGGYVTVVAVAGTAIGRTGETDLGVAMVATALVAAAFHPVRVRAHRLADRLVYGDRATPYEVLTAIAYRTGKAYAADDLLPDLARALAEGVGAARAEVWLLADRQLRCVARWPAAAARWPAVTVADHDEVPDLPGADELAAVRHQGELVGALTVALTPGHSLSMVERRLLADLAAQVGVALDNLRLVEEVKASRQRIVTAQDEERRRIERDIHDGVQQRLVSLSLALRIAAAELETTADGSAARYLNAAADEAREALSELRRLARGIHPAIVSEGGLVAALDSLVDRSPVPTEIVGVPVQRLPAPVEVTVYFLVAEALANVAKHAQASHVRVSVDQVDSSVRIDIADDGIGGALPGTGSGLTGLADRVAALSGTFAVNSPPGRGTRLRAVIPCASS